jgi:hypothetical protein
MIESITFTFYLALLAVVCSASAQTISITDHGTRHTENRTVDQNGREMSIRGLSGITREQADNYLAVMDNSNAIVRFQIIFKDDASVDAIRCLGGIALADTRDFEGIALSPRTGCVLLSEEQTPGVHEYRLSDGARMQTLELPKIYAPPNLRGNFGLEALAADNSVLWTSNEEALHSDGDRSDARFGSAVRLLRYRWRDGRFVPESQFVYVTEPIHKPYADADRSSSRSGLSDLILLPDGRLLALERSFSRLGPMDAFSDFGNRIFEIDLADATDVSTDTYARGLIGKRFNPVRKKLLWWHRGNDIGNLEGLALGRQIGENRWAAIGVVDNNGMDLLSNRVASFEIRIDDGAKQPTHTIGRK